MSVLEYFKTTPGRPMGGATGPRCIFFFKFATRSMAEKNERGACRPLQRATGACRPPQGRQGPSPYIRPGRHSLII